MTFALKFLTLLALSFHFCATTLNAQQSLSVPPRSLSLISDQNQVLGWLSGEGDYSGQEVQIQIDGVFTKVSVKEGNTFTWDYEVTQATKAHFSLGEVRQSLMLNPIFVAEPNVFFVLERSVYRPGQELKFAGFLRSLDQKAEFIPLKDQKITVNLVSDHKQTTATTLHLTSDEMGRVEGSYCWTDGDVMDQYTLSVAGFKGTAKVVLAEYRKSKIKLKIDGKVVEGKIDLKFEAVDFLEKPVKSSKVTFAAQVIHSDDEKKPWSLQAHDFAYFEKDSWQLTEPNNLSEDELLLLDSDITHLSNLSMSRKTVVAQFGDQLSMESGSASFPIEMKDEWLRGKHSVHVEAVVLDVNRHEHRATYRIPLNQTNQQLALRLPKRTFSTNESIPLQALASSGNGEVQDGKFTVVVMKLASGAKQASYYNAPTNFMSSPYQPYFHSGISQRRIPTVWHHAPASGEISRTVVTAKALENGSADMKISQPGAYKFVVFMQKPDGTSIMNEIGCVVRSIDETPALLLSTDKQEYRNGDTLTAEIHSRFADADFLVTLRDSSGFRLWQTSKIKGNYGKIELRLPDDLRYACDIAIQYVDEDGRNFTADQIIRVVPNHRFITIKTWHKEQVAPGEIVKLDFDVNRQEPVDLVVSVYDQSLLGITSDRQVDIRNFYLADERITRERERDILHRLLGSVSLSDVVNQAKQFLHEREKSASSKDQLALTSLREACYAIGNKSSLHVSHIASLAGFMGLSVYTEATYAVFSQSDWSKHDTITLADLIDQLQAGNAWTLRYRFYNGGLALSAHHPNLTNRQHDQYQWNRSSVSSPFLDNNLLNMHASPRADAATSNLGFMTGNASFSVEGQAAISHMSMPVIRPHEVTGASDSVTIRRDFSDAAFWNARVRTDANGHASVEFRLPDSLTNWQVVVTAVTKDLHVGTTSSRFRTFKPVMIWPLLPRNFTLGDTICIFGTVHNHTEKTQSIQATIEVNNGEIIDSPPSVTVDVPAKGNVPVYWTYRPAQTGFTEILMSAKCAEGKDASLKRLPVRDSAVWEARSKSGFCKGRVTFDVPVGIDISTARLDVSIAPSLAADMADTLDYLVDYPHGCVEQTMSRFVPAIKVAQILTQYSIKNPSLEAKLPKCVDMGIKRLIELQQVDGGWGWQGKSATHEMMTPYALYGLMQAEDAGYKIPNDKALQRGIDRLKYFIQSMGDSHTSDRIYCMYVYAQRDKLHDDWWAFIERQAKEAQLSDYATALSLEMAVKFRKKSLADQLAARLRKNAVSYSGTFHWKTGGFYRWGEDRNEITAVVLKALVAYNSKHEMIPGILSFFAQNKRGNRWNSTKDTAMILYAMCDYLATKNCDNSGQSMVTLRVNQGETMTLQLNDGLTKTLTFSGGDVKTGANVLTFLKGSPGVMYRLNLKYRQVGNSFKEKNNGLTVNRQMWLLDPENGSPTRELKDGDHIPRGSYVMSQVAVVSEVADRLRYVLVENPKPGSCEIQPVEDQRFRQNASPHVLREDKEVGVFWHHEEVGNQIHNSCVLRCEFAGEFVFAPAQVELMYQPEIRGHSGTIKLMVE